MIRKFRRTESYFKNKLDKENKTIAADDFDSQFNNIAGYLDTTIKPAIDNLVNAALAGVGGNAGAFLHNVGDGTTDWKQLDSDLLDDYSIAFDKIVKTTSGSVLIAGADGNLAKIVPTADHQVLLSRNENIPEWRKVGADDITNATLTGDQFGILAIENFTANQFITNIVPNVIVSENIQDGAITNNKLVDTSITSDKLGIFANLPVVTNGLTVDNIGDEAITSSKIMDNNIPITESYNGHSMGIWEGYGKSVWSVESPVIYTQLLRAVNILDNSIEDIDLAPILTAYSNITPIQMTAGAKTFFKEVPLQFQFQSRHLALNKLEYNYFNAEVQAAINRLQS